MERPPSTYILPADAGSCISNNYKPTEYGRSRNCDGSALHVRVLLRISDMERPETVPELPAHPFLSPQQPMTRPSQNFLPSQSSNSPQLYSMACRIFALLGTCVLHSIEADCADGRSLISYTLVIKRSTIIFSDYFLAYGQSL